LGFLTALKFLTIVPLPEYIDESSENFGKSLPYFPIIGLILGAILFGLYYGLSFILPPPLVSILLIIALAILTGAHHLDGLMDSFDGLVIGKSKERRLEIMADSRVGCFGIIAAILVLLTKYSSLTSLPHAMIMPALLLMPTLSRWLMVSALFSFPSAKTYGMGAAFKQGANWRRFTITTVIAILVSALLLNWQGIALLVVLWLIIFGIASYFNTRLDGLTGDVYGAINELSEVLVLILITILAWRFY
jgi:adenosylcobinamide-GDP ribazoletransferase